MVQHAHVRSHPCFFLPVTSSVSPTPVCSMIVYIFYIILLLIMLLRTECVYFDERTIGNKPLLSVVVSLLFTNLARNFDCLDFSVRNPLINLFIYLFERASERDFMSFRPRV